MIPCIFTLDVESPFLFYCLNCDKTPVSHLNFAIFLRMSRSLIPKSSYYFGPPPPDSAYGTAPIGQIGVHHPREILRVERDYTGGEVIQFAPIYPLELEGRVCCFWTLSGSFSLTIFDVVDTNTVLGIHQCYQRIAHLGP